MRSKRNIGQTPRTESCRIGTRSLRDMCRRWIFRWRAIGAKSPTHYPDAKIILTIRDSDRGSKARRRRSSIRSTRCGSGPTTWARLFAVWRRSTSRKVLAIAMAASWLSEAHNRACREAGLGARLLDYRVTEAGDRSAVFLGVPVPGRISAHQYDGRIPRSLRKRAGRTLRSGRVDSVCLTRQAGRDASTSPRIRCVRRDAVRRECPPTRPHPRRQPERPPSRRRGAARISGPFRQQRVLLRRACSIARRLH